MMKKVHSIDEEFEKEGAVNKEEPMAIGDIIMTSVKRTAQVDEIMMVVGAVGLIHGLDRGLKQGVIAAASTFGTITLINVVSQVANKMD